MFNILAGVWSSVILELQAYEVKDNWRDQKVAMIKQLFHPDFNFFFWIFQWNQIKRDEGAGNGVVSGAGANGSSSKTKEAVPYNVIAIGSQDCCISVWTTGSPRPVFIGKHFFQQSVVDLSWCVLHLMPLSITFFSTRIT